jgi:hypothetical protein
MVTDSNSDWEERYETFKKNSQKNPSQMLADYATAGNSDRGFTGASGIGSVFVRNNGVIDIFAKEGLGIKIDPDNDAVTVYTSKFNVVAKDINLYTDPYKLKWNKFPLNLQPTLMGEGVGVVTVNPGTLMPYNSAAEDAMTYGEKILGIFSSVGGA